MNAVTFKINKLDFLISFYIACLMMAELMGSKTFPLVDNSFLKLNASVGIFLVPILFSINDIVTEVYGADRARSLIRSGLAMILVLLLFTIFATSLTPSIRSADMELAYDTVFTFSTRISFASLVAFAFAEFLDVAVFQKIREKYRTKGLWLRNNASNFISQFFDTSIFMFLAFYQFSKSPNDNATFLVSLIIPYWLLKCGMSIIETPLVYLGVRWLREEKNS